MKKHLGTAIKLIISLGLGIFLITWMLQKMTPEQKEGTINAFKSANYFFIIISPLIGLASNFFRAKRWQLMLQPLGYNPSYKNTFFSVMIMYLANTFVPRLGEVSRCAILAKYENVPVEKSIGTMVTERIIDLVCVICIGLFLFIVERERLMTFFNPIIQKIKNLITNPFGGSNTTDNANHTLKYAIEAIIALAIISFCVYIIKKHGFQKLKNIVLEKLKSFIKSIISIKDLEKPYEFIFHTIAIWACYTLMIYVEFFAFSQTQSVGFTCALACLFFGAFAVVATPGGIGVYPLTIMAILKTYNVDETMAMAFGNMAWGVQTVGVLLGGIISLILLNIINKNKVATQS